VSTPISQAPPVTSFCSVRATKGMLTDAIQALQRLGGFLERVEAEGSGDVYRLWYRHPEIEGRETQLLFSRSGTKATVEIRDEGPVS
jgi:hypothetical protein